jgi:hypothetical protein
MGDLSLYSTYTVKEEKRKEKERGRKRRNVR